MRVEKIAENVNFRSRFQVLNIKGLEYKKNF